MEKRRSTHVPQEAAAPPAGGFHTDALDLVEEDPLIRSAAREAALNGPALSGRVRFVGVHGLERVAACPLLREAQPGVPVVLYTLRDDLCARLHALHGCADAYAVLVTGASGAGGRRASAGSRFEMLCGPDPLAAAGITAREADVLALMIARHSDAEIAGRLVISVTTVRTHCRSILRKLGARSRRDVRERLLPE
jgi:DNA-binding CsgD family transcriptional regulator